jgi:hypothetical protein
MQIRDPKLCHASEKCVRILGAELIAALHRLAHADRNPGCGAIRSLRFEFVQSQQKEVE